MLDNVFETRVKYVEFIIDLITKLADPWFSKTFVLVISRVYKFRPRLNIIEHHLLNQSFIFTNLP